MDHKQPVGKDSRGKKASQSQGFVVGAGPGAEIIHQRAFMSDGAEPAMMKFQQQAECTVAWSVSLSLALSSVFACVP